MNSQIQIRVSPKEAADEQFCLSKAAHGLGLSPDQVRLRKKSIDARGRNPVFVLTYESLLAVENDNSVLGFGLQQVAGKKEVHIIGFGPAGIFAALKCIEMGFKPVVFERGKEVKERRRDLALLMKTQEVNPDSNYCFGEGGAGTYSDGKLYTRSVKRGPLNKALGAFVQFGAKSEIMIDAHPHIGTNKLPGIIEKMREAIVDCGGEVHFDSRVTDFVLDGDVISKIAINGNMTVKVDNLILATGHSARDIFELLHAKSIRIEAKPFAMGVRIEHPQALIDSIQYHCDLRGPYLPPASYSLVEQVQGRGVFSFCMCPGGIIAPAATAAGEVVVNGWSPSKRNGKFANSGFVVTVDDKDFAGFQQFGELRAMQYQSHYEQLAFGTKNNLTAPAQRVEDFIQNTFSSTLPDCSYIPGIGSRKMDEVLSKDVSSRIRGALVELGKKMKGFRTNEAVLVGVESRTSSPVRIPRDPVTLKHVQIQNLYPCAEGAGYAGGIMSAALDGIKVADAVMGVSNQEQIRVSSVD